MSDLDLEPIKARLDKAHTEWGPWKAKEDSWDGYSVVIDDNGPGVSIIAEQIGQGEDEGWGDAEFIAHAPEDIAALIAEVEKIRKEQNALLIACLSARSDQDRWRRINKGVSDAIRRHPDPGPCGVHTEDDPVSCGWKNAYRDVVNAFKGVEQ